MVSKLAQQQKFNTTLGIPLSSIVMQGFKDNETMVHLIEMAITEYTNDPSQSQQAKPRVVPKVIKALTDAEMALQVCAGFREGPVTGNTCLKTTCKRQHIVATTNCTHPVYLKYGRCPDFFTTCKLLHPFPEAAKAAYGSPGDGWTAYQMDKAKAKKSGRSLFPIFQMADRSEVGSSLNMVEGPRANRGTTRPQQGFNLIAEAVEMADIDFISSAVPPGELQAALEDEDFSMGSDINSDELARAIPQEEYDQMDFDQDTALQIQAAMDLLDITNDSEDYIPSSSTSDDEPTGSAPHSPEADRLRSRATDQEIMQILQSAGPNHIMNALEEHIPMIMFDGGAFMHIWGTMLVSLDILTDQQELKEPLRVQTAKGSLSLTTLATLTLRGNAFVGAINPHMQLSLISEGVIRGTGVEIHQ
jgi:hypothetical protein